jgi:hypothetical protein
MGCRPDLHARRVGPLSPRPKLGSVFGIVFDPVGQ